MAGRKWRVPDPLGSRDLPAVVGGDIVGYRTGKRLEASLEPNRRHILVSAALTAAPLLLLVLQQWSIGSLGKHSGSLVCRDLCLEKGYPASGMPPKNTGEEVCICYDSVQEVLRIPLNASLSGQQTALSAKQ